MITKTKLNYFSLYQGVIDRVHPFMHRLKPCIVGIMLRAKIAFRGGDEARTYFDAATSLKCFECLERLIIKL